MPAAPGRSPTFPPQRESPSVTRDETLTHDLFVFPFPAPKINATGLGSLYSPGFLHRLAAHTELPTLSGILRRLRCKKSKVSCVAHVSASDLLVGKGETPADVSTRHMSYM